jgi:hypothetical protein
MQGSLFPKAPLFYGGEIAPGRRKTMRPLATNRPLHLVLKAGISLGRHEALVTRKVKRLVERFSCRVYDCAVAPDHVHLALLIPGRREYRAFIRSLSGLLARKIQKGLFVLLPFTRVVSWGRDFRLLKSYIRKNQEEASGARPYEPRRDWYCKFKKWPAS